MFVQLFVIFFNTQKRYCNVNRQICVNLQQNTVFLPFWVWLANKCSLPMQIALLIIIYSKEKGSVCCKLQTLAEINKTIKSTHK